MATIEAILKISDENKNGEITQATASVQTNNISSTPYTTNLLPFIESMNDEKRAYSGAVVTMLGNTPTIGALRFGALLPTGQREETYKGVLLGNSGANANNTLTITLVGDSIIGIGFVFDNYIGLYPTAYSYTDINGRTITRTNQTSNVVEIDELPAYSGTTTITFTNWNMANTPIGITFVSFPTEKIPLTKAEIVSFKSQSQIISSTNGINYGVIPTTAEIEINDRKNTLYEKAKMGYLNAFLFTLELIVNGKAIQTHISTNSPLYTSDRKLELDLTDELALWDNIIVSSESEPKTFNAGQNLYDVVYYLVDFDSNINILDMCSDTIMTGNDSISFQEQTIENYLKGIIFNANTTLQEATLREQFEKVCNCAQLMIYVNRDNEIKFTSARPIYNAEDNVIAMPFKKQYSRPDYDLLLSNKYEDVEFR